MDVFRIMKCLCLMILMSFAINIYALPFNIVPKANTQLPTTVVSGSSVFAYYTVTNLTRETRSNTFVEYLPPNVTQVSTGGTYPDTCAANFNLNMNGSAGDSCTLQLAVSGPVSSSDPDPKHHLFVCSPGARVCAGTAYPLNVTTQTQALTAITISPATQRIGIGRSRQFSARGVYNDGSSQDISNSVTWVSSNPSIVTISSNGVATGIAFGSATITASLNGITSNVAQVTVQSVAYVTNTSANNISLCPVNANGSFGTCSIAGILPSANGILFNSNLTIVYLTDIAGNQVYYCPVNVDGTFGTCTPTASNLTYTNPSFLVFNPQHTRVYLSDSNGNRIVACSIATDNSLVNCIDAGAGEAFFTPQGFSFNSSGSQVYIANQNSSTISVCSVNLNGLIQGCQNTALGVSFSLPSDVVVNASDTFAYITDALNNRVVYCAITGGGLLTGCLGTGTNLNAPFGLSFGANGTSLYMANFFGNSVTRCDVDQSLGSLANCTVVGTGFTNPVDIVLN